MIPRSFLADVVRWADRSAAAAKPRTKTIPCPDCGGEGRLLSGNGMDPYPKDYGECESCWGTGEVEREVEEENL